MKKRFRQVVWCKCCNKELASEVRLCADCGATYLNNRIDPYAVIQEECPLQLIIKFKWYDPTTWGEHNEYWQTVNVRDCLGMVIF